MIQFGNDKLKDIYYGSEQIKEIYYGSEKVWGEIESIQGGYWIHKDTGVKTYFGLEDSSIDGEVMYPPSWREDCSEVNIPVGVIYLERDCFSGCESLISITLPEGVTYLGNNCFSNCSSLTSITLPESVRYLELSCFSGCIALVSITLPESLTSLGLECFFGCVSLTSITIPENVTSIGAYCFIYCNALTLATVLPAIPPTLGDSAFLNTHASFNIKVHSPYVNDYKTATNWVAYADKISAIGAGYWIHKDTGIKTDFGTDADFITDGVMSSPSWAYDCSEVKIPSGVTGLGYACFQGSSSLTTITIPDSVTSFGNGCFVNCSSLTSIYSLGSTAPGLSGSPFGDFSPGNGEYTGRNTYNQGVNMLYVPQGATGYDASYWLDPLQDATKCGFTISYTL